MSVKAFLLLQPHVCAILLFVLKTTDAFILHETKNKLSFSQFGFFFPHQMFNWQRNLLSADFLVFSSNGAQGHNGSFLLSLPFRPAEELLGCLHGWASSVALHPSKDPAFLDCALGRMQTLTEAQRWIGLVVTSLTS